TGGTADHRVRHVRGWRCGMRPHGTDVRRAHRIDAWRRCPVSSRAAVALSTADRRNCTVMNDMSRRLLYWCLGGVVSSVAACGATEAPSRRTLIDSRDTYDPRSLDPALSTDVPTGRAVGYLFDGLTRFDPSAKVEPALAERWDVTTD